MMMTPLADQLNLLNVMGGDKGCGHDWYLLTHVHFLKKCFLLIFQLLHQVAVATDNEVKFTYARAYLL